MVLGAAVSLAFSPVVAQAQSTQGQAETAGRGSGQERTLTIQTQTPGPLTVGDSPVSVDDTPTSPWGVRSTVDINCVACVPGLASIPANPNAPWSLYGTVRHESRLGGFSAGFVGVHNYAPPLYSVMSIGGAYSPGGASSSVANFFVPSTQWHLTASFQRTLVTTAAGATLGLTADVLVPVKTDAAVNDSLGICPLPSGAVRFGMVFRW